RKREPVIAEPAATLDQVIYRREPLADEPRQRTDPIAVVVATGDSSRPPLDLRDNRMSAISEEELLHACGALPGALFPPQRPVSVIVFVRYRVPVTPYSLEDRAGGTPYDALSVRKRHPRRRERLETIPDFRGFGVRHRRSSLGKESYLSHPGTPAMILRIGAHFPCLERAIHRANMHPRRPGNTASLNWA